MLRPASWLALLSRRFTFELSLTGSPKANVEYNYLDKLQIRSDSPDDAANGFGFGKSPGIQMLLPQTDPLIEFRSRLIVPAGLTVRGTPNLTVNWLTVHSASSTGLPLSCVASSYIAVLCMTWQCQMTALPA
jgi:hypothetical protein